MSKFDGYVRVSRVGRREGESFISPHIQRETIERLAKAKGLKLGEVVEELDVSAFAAPRTGRSTASSSASSGASQPESSSGRSRGSRGRSSEASSPPTGSPALAVASSQTTSTPARLWARRCSASCSVWQSRSSTPDARAGTRRAESSRPRHPHREPHPDRLPREHHRSRAEREADPRSPRRRAGTRPPCARSSCGERPGRPGRNSRSCSCSARSSARTTTPTGR